MFVLPFQHSSQKFFATEIVARFILGPAQKFLHSGLSSDSRMIHSRQPKDFESLHPRAACENVLDRVVQNMAERKHARDVRRWHHNRKRWLRGLRICYEIAILQSALIPLRFNRIRIVPLGKVSHRDQSSESGARLQMTRVTARDQLHSGEGKTKAVAAPCARYDFSRYMSNPRPIGVFDSGIGGLTVVKALRERLPNETIVYLGDTARVPYGPKSPDTVQRYALELAHMLLKKNAKALVVACNTVSSVALPLLTRKFSVPVIGVIEPGARAALQATRNQHVGVIGTRATIRSAAYEKALRATNNNVRVSSRACP